MTAKNKSKISSPFLIGLFVIIGVGLIISVIIWLGANQFLKEQVYYVTYFDSSVEGLEQGSPVKYQGVPAGNVADINVAPDSVLVEVIMRIDQNIRINKALRVQQTMSGLTGGKFLQLLYPENSDSTREIRSLPFKTPYKYIIATPSSLEETMIAAREVVNNLKDLQINKLNSKIIQFLDEYRNFIQSKEIASIIENISNSTNRIENILVSADTSDIIRNLEFSTEQLVKSSNEVINITKNLNNQVKDMKLPEYIDKMYLRYDSTMVTADNTIKDVNYRAQNFLIELNLIIDELKQTNDDLQKSLRAISDAPSQIFLSDPPPKEK